jgi:type VII secretion effector (TIGR04197 family)
MAAITFPSNPTLNQVYTVGDRSWKFNGVAWKLQAKTTDGIIEGSSNLFFTEARVASAPAVTALETRASGIESAASALEARVGTAEGEIDTLQSGLATAQSDIDTLETRVDNVLSNVDPSAIDSLTEVVAAFEAADSNLNNAISSLAGAASSGLAAETSAREAADSALDTRLTSVEGDVNTMFGTQIPELYNEVGRLDTRIDNEEAARLSGDEALQSAIDDESASRQAHDDVLAGQITDHETRLQSAEGSIAGLGTMSTQNASSVAITGGTISGVSLTASSLEVGSGQTADLFVSEAGNVGIGTEAPTERLTVAGNISATGTASASAPTENSHLTTKSYVDTATNDLSDRINTEVSDRESAISTLTDRVANIESNVDPAALDSLTEVVSAFQSADQTINGAITSLAASASSALEAETEAREAADSALSGRLTTVEGDLGTHTADTNNPHSVTKAQVGLGNADNTSDADKPVSTAQASAISSAKSEAISDAGDYTDTEVATRQIKDTLSATAPVHEEGRRWVDTTDMTEYVSFGGAWVELDRA